MDEYILDSNEVLLFESKVMWNEMRRDVNLMLTSYALVLSYKERVGKAFHKTIETRNNVFQLNEIKQYNGTPQIKQMLNKIKIQTVSSDITIVFNSMIDAIKFTKRAVDAATKTSIAQRGAGKVKDAISLVDDTLGIDSVDTVKSVVDNGVVGTIVHGNNGTSLVGEIIGAANSFIGDNSYTGKSSNGSLSINEQVEAVKKLKELLDAGILTEEEFIKKKKEVMEL